MRTTQLTAAALGLAALSGTSSAQDLVISEIIDATLPGGVPKLVELTNNSAGVIDLSNFSIGNLNNGALTMAFDALVLSGMLAPGDTYLISYEDNDGPGVGLFFDTFGCDPDNFDNGPFFNGDDVIVLYQGAGLIGDDASAANPSGAVTHDVYGVVGVDGSGQPWEYTDSFAIRNNTTAGGAVFNIADWTIPGANTLEGTCAGDDVCEAANLVSMTTPTPQGGCNAPPAGFPENCNGDGGDQMGCTDCPCGNNAAPGTVGGCLNSGGTSSRLIGSGSGSIAAADLRFEASGVAPSNSCVLTSGNALAPAQMVNPCFGLNSGVQSVSLDGLRCAVQQVLRHGVRPSDANGDVGVTTNGWGTPNGFFNFAAFMDGQTKHFQIIHRDDAAQVCMTGQNTSQAVSVTFSM